MRSVKVVAVLGPKDTYKTRAAELIISRLSSMGLRVGGVKHLHSSRVDRPGKDTWRMAEAGASIVIAVGEGEVAAIERRRPSLREVLGAIEGRVDVVVVEGFKREAGAMGSVVKVLTARSLEELEELLSSVEPPIAAITGPIAEGLRSWRGVPVVNLDEDPSLLLDSVLSSLSLRARSSAKKLES
ncbi:MAG: molybdopterin-guanine dinucleotide biosynthesis protein B [Candidatus Nezhaarchaeota archaeon]|nr:molybdopterin-guanine dinucleotide biosynthesis protein B [Candidatus Nezhaarchaeota archaeon]